MRILKRIYFASVLVLALVSTATAQERATVQGSTLTITASSTGERVRITAPASVVQMHVEVYAAGGEKLFDQEIRGGNVFDWHLQDGQGQRLAAGDYVCVVTAKSVSGKLTQKIGTVTIAETSASVQPAAALSAPQAQTIGPVEENSSWTIPGNDEPQTTTVIAHDGTDGQMIRGRGALTFRIGNFFSGIDQEQMRLTEAGDLGLGTSAPKAKLDVAGAIRAERFLVAKPNKTGGDKTASGAQADSVDSVQPLVAGTGTTGQLTKWKDDAGTLEDSVITQLGTNIGIGTTSPGRQLTLSQSGGAEMSWIDATSGQNWMWQENGSSYFKLYDLTNGKDVMSFQPATGYVGIGTTSPSRQLTLRQPGGAEMAWIDSTSGQNWMWQENGATSLRLFDVTNSKDVLAFLPSSGNVGIGITNPTAKLDVAGDVLFEGKWRSETTAYTPNLIGGFLGTGSGGATPGNRVTPGVVGATIGGGGFNGTLPFPSGDIIIGDNTNRVTDWFGTVGGGFNNRAGNSDGVLDNATYATVGGGVNNSAGGLDATVGGGSGNIASAVATVGGGQNNNASGFSATVGGGDGNIAGDNYASVGGGSNNNAQGQFATVPGGWANVALGDYSLATGQRAKANHPGTFVWSDSTNADFASTGNNQFLIRATGGVGIGTTAPANPLDVNGVGTQSGGVGGFGEVAARFRQSTAGTHSAVSIDALSGQDAVLYLAENGAAVWGIRNDSDQGGKFQIRLQSSGVNRPYFSLNPTGEVGLGTTTPNATLQVTSTTTEQVLSATSNLTTGTWFNLGNTNTSGNTWNFISTGTAPAGGAGKLYIRDNNASQVRVAIDTAGNVGIGTTGPNAKMHVVGGDVAITTQSYGVILRATDDGTGTKCFRLTVNSVGTLSTFALACP